MLFDKRTGGAGVDVTMGVGVDSILDIRSGDIFEWHVLINLSAQVVRS